MTGSGYGGLDQDERRKVSADGRRWTQMKNGQSSLLAVAVRGILFIFSSLDRTIPVQALKILIRSYFWDTIISAPMAYIPPPMRKIQSDGKCTCCVIHPSIGPVAEPRSDAVTYPATEREPRIPASACMTTVAPTPHKKNITTHKINNPVLDVIDAENRANVPVLK